MLEITAPVVPNATPVLPNPQLVAAECKFEGAQFEPLWLETPPHVLQNFIIGMPKYTPYVCETSFL